MTGQSMHSIRRREICLGSWMARMACRSSTWVCGILQFGNGGNGGSKSDLYFTAGIPGDGIVEDHGLFGSIVPTPEPGTFALFGIGLLVLIGTARRRKNAAIA